MLTHTPYLQSSASDGLVKRVFDADFFRSAFRSVCPEGGEGPVGDSPEDAPLVKGPPRLPMLMGESKSEACEESPVLSPMLANRGKEKPIWLLELASESDLCISTSDRSLQSGLFPLEGLLLAVDCCKEGEEEPELLPCPPTSAADLLPTRSLVSAGEVLKAAPEERSRSAAVFPDLSLASPSAPRARSSSTELVFPLTAAMWRAVRPVSAVAASNDAPESRSSPNTWCVRGCRVRVS